MSIVKNVTVLIYHFSSVSLSSFLILPFKNNRYNKEKLMPDKNMNIQTHGLKNLKMPCQLAPLASRIMASAKAETPFMASCWVLPTAPISAMMAPVERS